ncbi:hypothetical protein OIU76_005299 [Salix suchowensis]|uniref:SHSP domain-containing protein n=1 Tax=Salix suchowensis TaxID=1278906 RepID=A0ABQ9AC19_9ROSI|nr:Posttranslational modification, protein turnover, chaperone [Salix suchowensis]KAJ6319690.1 hypothetical protein OIU78_015162 [Salix suchowensis]KAJ6329269.1 hypothetical protein OIU77_010864 [Salix suchowensis]KAJ6343530.1 hypothetical protein OIU76_005299 [Salix suchowensis]
MDSESVRRRMNMIAAHFAPTIADDISSPARLLPLNCSGSLNSVIRRYDNRMYFARQGSASQACFMRQAVSIQQQGSSEKGLRSSASSETEWSCNAELVRDETPLFSRPAKIKPNLPKVEPALTPAKYCKSTMSALPKFARPNRSIINSRKGQCQFEKTIYSPESNGIEWSPKMDVVESGVNYVLTIEIPGVNFNDIRVEIHGQNLKVTGKRSNQSWKRAPEGCSSILRYHKRDILEGPYEIVWRLPVDGNKDSVSAEFLHGFLQVTVPKM